MKPVGYWPKELFRGMTDQAGYAGFGGTVEAPINRPTPPMGSGHFPSEGDGKAAYFQYIELVDKHNQFVIPDPELFDLVCSKPRCYQVSKLTETLQGLQFFFGGPGDCKG
ncbi:hypothetical protein LUZ63_019133 [Rhynchospora breviuscula]|uniref:Neprosin PEP catalytic domain-containing protein n=1 Tax=Rhynchospora breviuscula TaxID=2022672 RepID=A0A9Q0C5M7_9POAL|nr:hypothetical protein LUZ63_019133 [Rhynchospora breviuscula]